MPSVLTIRGTAMQTNLQLNEIPRALATESPELVVFEWRPIPGRIMGAAFDWVAVLGTAADLIAIAGALWAVYEKLIKSRKKLGETKGPAFLIQVQSQRETFIQVVIKAETSKEVFVDEFCRTVSSIRTSGTDETEQTIIETYEKLECFNRIHVHKDL